MHGWQNPIFLWFARHASSELEPGVKHPGLQLALIQDFSVIGGSLNLLSHSIGPYSVFCLDGELVDHRHLHVEILG